MLEQLGGTWSRPGVSAVMVVGVPYCTTNRKDLQNFYYCKAGLAKINKFVFDYF